MDGNSEEYLKECRKFLDYFRVDYSGDTIYLHDGQLGMIMNHRNRRKVHFHKIFIGATISSVVIDYVKKTGKKAEWLNSY